jgi:hypothetical protein
MLADQAASHPAPTAPPQPQGHQLPQWAKVAGMEDPWFGGPGHAGAEAALVNGMTAGYGDEIFGGLAAAEHNAIPFLTGKPTNFQQDYADVRDAYRDAAKHYKDQHPVMDTLTPVFSAPFMGVAGAGRSIAENPGFWNRVKGAAASGALVGGIAGFGSGEGSAGQRLKSAADEGLHGAAAGAAFVPGAYAMAGGASALGRLLGGKNSAINSKAAKIITGALADDGISPAEAAAKIGNDPTGQLMLPDLGGENSKIARLGRALVTANTPASKEITSAINERDAGQFGRFAGSIRRDLSSDTDTYGNLENLVRQRGQEAGPLYEQAYEGGSIAPFEDQLRDHLQAATGSKGIIARQMKEIEQSNPGALAARGAAGKQVRDRYMQLSDQLKQAEQTRQNVQAMFAKAKEDGTGGAPGAVWSPRVQQFLNDPIVRHGLNEGLEIERLEALAEGRQMNPSEYAVVGKDSDGKAIVGAVPNMRLLNAAKIGLDKILEGYRDKTTMRLALDQRGRAIDSVRRAFVNELDNLNPAYKAARKAWAGPSAAMDAVGSGQDFLRMDPEQIGKVQSGMSDAERDFFRVGAARALLDRISKAGDGADLTKRLYGNPQIREQIKAAFGPEAAAKLDQAMASEKAMFETGNFITGNSATVNKAHDFGAGSAVRKVLGEMIQGGLAGFMVGGPKGAAIAGIGMPLSRLASEKLSRMVERNALTDPETAAQLGKMLLSRGKVGAEELRGSVIPFAQAQATKNKMIGKVLAAQPVVSLVAAEK